MRTPAPCYDTVNHKDCPRRQWCKTVGRVKYEKAHQAELEQRHKEAEMRNAAFENSMRIRKKLSKRSRY